MSCSVDSAEVRAQEAAAKLKDYGTSDIQSRPLSSLPSAADAFQEVKLVVPAAMVSGISLAAVLQLADMPPPTINSSSSQHTASSCSCDLNGSGANVVIS